MSKRIAVLLKAHARSGARSGTLGQRARAPLSLYFPQHLHRQVHPFLPPCVVPLHSPASSPLPHHPVASCARRCALPTALALAPWPLARQACSLPRLSGEVSFAHGAAGGTVDLRWVPSFQRTASFQLLPSATRAPRATIASSPPAHCSQSHPPSFSANVLSMHAGPPLHVAALDVPSKRRRQFPATSQWPTAFAVTVRGDQPSSWGIV